MQARFIAHVVIFCVILGALVSLAGCGGGSSESSERQPGTEQATPPSSEALSTVQGTVAGVSTQASMRSRDDNPSMFAQLKNFLAILRTAEAQSNGVAAIDVRAVRDGATLDADSTDVDGRFELTFPAGDIGLMFSTEAFSVTLEISTSAGGTLTLVVRLSPGGVDIDAIEPINCTSGTVNIAEMGSDLTIDAAGGTCILATNECEVNLRANTLLLTNCTSCIDVRNTATVNLRTRETLHCMASEDGIKTANNAEVNLTSDGAGDIIITAADTGAATGLNASGASEINLSTSNGNIIIGDEGALEDVLADIGLNAEGNANVNINASKALTITAVDIGIRALDITNVRVQSTDCAIKAAVPLQQGEEATLVIPDECQLLASIAPPEPPQELVSLPPITCQTGEESFEGYSHIGVDL